MLKQKITNILRFMFLGKNIKTFFFLMSGPDRCMKYKNLFKS